MKSRCIYLFSKVKTNSSKNKHYRCAILLLLLLLLCTNTICTHYCSARFKKGRTSSKNTRAATTTIVGEERFFLWKSHSYLHQYHHLYGGSCYSRTSTSSLKLPIQRNCSKKHKNRSSIARNQRF